MFVAYLPKSVGELPNIVNDFGASEDLMSEQIQPPK